MSDRSSSDHDTILAAKELNERVRSWKRYSETDGIRKKNERGEIKDLFLREYRDELRSRQQCIIYWAAKRTVGGNIPRADIDDSQ